MSTALTTSRPDAGLPSAVRTVGMTASLAYHVSGGRMLDGHVSPHQGKPSAGDVAEARKVLPVAQRMCNPAEPRVIASWLEMFRALPSAPKEPDAVRSICAAMVLANGDLPAAVWTAETAAEGLRTFRFYPSPAEVRDLLEPRAKRFWAQRDGLARIAAHAQSEQAQVADARTPEAQTYVQNLVARFVQERQQAQAASIGAVRPKVEAKHLSPSALEALYEQRAAQGDRMAQTRLDAIRARRGEGV